MSIPETEKSYLGSERGGGGGAAGEGEGEDEDAGVEEKLNAGCG